jgi:phage anti-repressor protein
LACRRKPSGISGGGRPAQPWRKLPDRLVSGERVQFGYACRHGPIPAEFQGTAVICEATEVVIGGRTVIGIADATKLHKGLKVRTKFADWIRGRIAKYGFVEGIDFIVSEKKEAKDSTAYDGAQTAHIYSLTLDVAKELAMVENNDLGRMARRYFIWAETLINADPSLSAQNRAAIGGIVKGSVNKSLVPFAESQLATNDKVDALAISQDRMDGRLATMASQLKALMDGFDPRQIVVTDYKPMLQVLIDEGVTQSKGRGPFVRFP